MLAGKLRASTKTAHESGMTVSTRHIDHLKMLCQTAAECGRWGCTVGIAEMQVQAYTDLRIFRALANYAEKEMGLQVEGTDSSLTVLWGPEVSKQTK